MTWSKDYYARTRLKQIRNVQERNKRKPREYLLRTAKRRANEKNIELTITVNDILIPEYCPVLGLKLEVHVVNEAGRPMNHSASLDRIDNSKGYIPGNVRVISWRANRLKCDGTLDEFLLIVEDFKNNNNESN